MRIDVVIDIDPYAAHSSADQLAHQARQAVSTSGALNPYYTHTFGGDQPCPSVRILLKAVQRLWYSGLPWRTSQSPASGLERTLLDLPPLFPQEEPVRELPSEEEPARSDHCRQQPSTLQGCRLLARFEIARECKSDG